MTTTTSTETAKGTCPLCGEALQDPDRCSKCDWVRESADENVQARQARDITALALSVIPGAGHLFKGYKLLGWVLMLVGVPVVVVFAFAFTMFFGWLMIPTYWIAVGADAYFRRDLRPPTPATSR